MEVFGLRLRHYRERAKASQRELCRIAGIDHAIGSRVEGGARSMPESLRLAYERHVRVVIDVEKLSVRPVQEIETLKIELGLPERQFGSDEFRSTFLAFTWEGKTGDNFFVPRLEVDYSTAKQFCDPICALSELTEESDSGGVRSWNLASLREIPPFTEFQESWRYALPDRHRRNLRFRVPDRVSIPRAEVRFWYAGDWLTPIEISWNRAQLRIPINKNPAVLPVGLIIPREWYTIGWKEGILADSDRDDYSFRHELERRGWIQVTDDTWKSRYGRIANIDQLRRLLPPD